MENLDEYLHHCTQGTERLLPLTHRVWRDAAFFALISGYFFYIATAYFVQRSIQSAMMGQSFPDGCERDGSPAAVIECQRGQAFFLIPMSHHVRLFAEEKRTGTIELLVTSPLTDLEIILGKWLAAMVLYVAMLGEKYLDAQRPAAVRLRQPRLEADADRLPRIDLARWLPAGDWNLDFDLHQESDRRRRGRIRDLPVALLVLDWVSQFNTSAVGQVIGYLSVLAHFDSFAKGVLDSKDIIYYLSVIFVGLFLTARSRWNRCAGEL